MLALVLKKNKVLKLAKVAEKKLLKKQYKIKVNYTGFCASDIPRIFENGAYNYPLIIGHEFCGKIIECGIKAKKFNKNDIVSVYPLIPKCNQCNSCKSKKYQLCEKYSYYGSRENGSMAEYINVNEWNIFKLNKHFPKKLGCLMEPISVAFNIFNQIQNKNKNKNKNILIIGGGFIGLILSGILNYYKFTHVDIIDRNKYRLAKIQNKTYKKIVADINKVNLKKKYYFLVDLIANKKSLDSCLESSTHGGSILIAGNVYKNINLSKTHLNYILRKELSINGIWNSNFKNKECNWLQAQKFIIKKKRWISSLITHNVTLNNSKKLFHKIYSSKKTNSKFKFIKCIIKNN